MLSFEEQKVVNFILRTACRIYIFPHNWCISSNRMTVTTSRLKQVGVRLNCCLSLVYTAFLAIRLKPDFVYSRAELTALSFELLLHYFWTAVHFTCFVIQVFSIQHEQDFALLFNQLLHFNRESGKHFFGKEYRDEGICQKILKFLLVLLGIVCMLFVTVSISFPGNRHYVYSAIGSLKGWRSYWMCVLFELFLTTKAGVCDAFYLVFGFFYVWSFSFWIKKACFEWIQRENVSEVGITEADSIKVYRVLTYINTLYNHSISLNCVPAMKTCIEILGVFAMYGTLRFYNELHIALYLTFPATAVLFVTQSMIVISLLAKVNSESIQFQPNFKLQLWRKSSLETQYWKRVIPSCRPIQCRIGAPYFVERSTKLKYAGLLLDLVLTLLMTSKSRH